MTCAHVEARSSVDSHPRPVCTCGCSESAHRIDTVKQRCDGCPCPAYRWCHDVTTTRTSTITRRTKETL